VRRLTLLLTVLAACGGTTPPARSGTTGSEPAADPQRTPTRAHATPESTARPFPIALTAIVPQLIDGNASVIDLESLPGNRLLVLGSHAAFVTGADLRVERRIEFGAIARRPTPVFVEREGRYVITSNGRLDLVANEFVPREATPFVTCDARAARCVEAEAGNDEFKLRIVDAATGARTSEVAVPKARLVELVPGNPNIPMRVDSAAIDGDAMFVSFGGAPFRLCRIDLPTRAVSRCTAGPENGRIAFADVTANRVCVRTFGEFGCADATTLETTRPPASSDQIIEVADDGSTYVAIDDGSIRVHDATTHEPFETAIEDDTHVALGAGGRYAVLSEREVLFFERSRELGRASLAVEVDEGHDDGSVAAPVHLHYVGESVIAFSSWRGVARVRPGDSDVRFAGPRIEDHVLLPVANEIPRFQSSTQSIRIGEAGIAVGLVPEPGASSTEDDRFSELFPNADEYSERAIAPEGTPGAHYAFLEAGKLRVTDAVGHNVVPMVRLPANVARSQCLTVEFVSDVSVALSGPAPCIPTLINFRTGRNRPLGRAYVHVDRTPDRRRVALMANREVQILDGATGESLVTIDANVEHPRSVAISPDGRRVALYGTDDFAIFDISAVADGRAAASSIRRSSETGARAYGYDAASDLVYGCSEGKLRVTRPFDPESESSIEFAACRPRPEAGREFDGIPIASFSAGPMMSWSETPGFLAAYQTDFVSIYRIRDSAVLSVRVYASTDSIALVFVEGTNAIGTFPDRSELLSFRDAATNRAFEPAASAEDMDRRVREFFAAR